MSETRLDIQNGVAYFTLSNPERRNAVTPAILDGIRQHLSAVWDDAAVRCIVFRGEGEKAFSAGYDLRSFSETSGGPREAAEHLGETLELLSSIPKPTVALLNGHAIGAGCELAVTCDIRWAVDEAVMGMPPAKLGLVYSPEGIGRFLALIGPAKTAELFYSAVNVRASEAARFGLVNDAWPRERFGGETAERLQTIVENAPHSHAGHAFLIRRLSALRLGVEEQRLVRELRERALSSPDAREGLQAFLEKRKPEFTG